MNKVYPRYRHVVFSMVWISQFMIVIAMFCHYVLVDEFMKDPLLQLTPSQAGWVLSIAMLMNAIVSVPTGMIMDRFGYRKLVAVVIAGCGLSLILRATSTNFPTFLLFTALTGIFFSVDYPTKVIGVWYPPKERGTAFFIFWASWMGAFIIMSITWPFLMPMSFIAYSWRRLFLFLGALVIVTAVPWFTLIRDRPDKLKIKTFYESGNKAIRTVGRGQESYGVKEVIGVPLRKSITSCLRSTNLWAVSVLRLFGGVVFSGTWAWLFSLLTLRGMSQGAISAIFGVRQLYYPFYIWVGVVSDKVGRRKPFVTGFAMLMAIACFILGFQINLPLLMAASVLFSIGYSVVGAVLYLLPVEMKDVGPGLAGTASGLNSFFDNIGGWVGPLLGGYILEFTGSLDGAYWLYIGSALSLACVSAVSLRETRRE